MDIKISGLSYEILEQALNQAKEGRLHILGEMLKTIDAPREDYKSHVPRIVSIEVPEDTIGAIIGPGGKVIQEIQKVTETTITIEEDKDRKVGIVEILSTNKEGMEAAKKRVELIAFPPQIEVGVVYDGKVKSIVPYGAFIEVLPGIDGLLHVSEIEWARVENVADILKEGDEIQVKVTGMDPKNPKKFKLSRKVLLPKPERKQKTVEDKEG